MEDNALTFAHPEMLWVLSLLLLVVILRQFAVMRSERLLRHLVASRLKEQLLRSMHPWLRLTKFWLTILGLAGVILALARPQWGVEEGAATRRGLDVMIVLDTSRSMLAEDIQPNRLERAKYAVQDLMGVLQGDRLGLVAFAGDAYLQCPLTTDYGAFMSILDEVDTELLPTGGTNIATAIEEALAGFNQSESSNRAIVLITDGEELNDDVVAMAQEASDKGVRIFAVGFGTPNGAKIPLTQNGETVYVTDETGQEVVSKLDEERLREVASATDGMYLLFEGSGTVRKLMDQGLATMTREDIDTRESRRAIERFQWPLGLGIGLLVLSAFMPENRRVRRPARNAATTVATSLILLFGLMSVRADDSAADLFDQERYKEALTAYEEQRQSDERYRDRLDYGAGTSAYKAGDYEKASQYLGRALVSDDASLRAKASYNLGNTFYRIGEAASDIEAKKENWQSAIEQYQSAEASGGEVGQQARHNRELVERKLKELEQEQKEEEQESDPEEKPEEEQENQDEQDQDQQEGDQENQDPQDQKDEGQEGEDKQDQGEQEQDPQDQGEQEQEPQDQGEQDPQDQGEQDQKEGQEGDEPQDPSKGGNEPQEEEQDGENSGEKPQPGSPSDQSGDQPEEGEQESSQQPQEPEPSDDLDGEVKPQESNPQNAEPKEGAEQQPSAYELTPDGKMSEAAARALLESLEGEELMPPMMRRSERARVLRDW